MLFGPDANERWNLPCLRRDGTRPEEQRVAEVASVGCADLERPTDGHDQLYVQKDGRTGTELPG